MNEILKFFHSHLAPYKLVAKKKLLIWREIGRIVKIAASNDSANKNYSIIASKQTGMKKRTIFNALMFLLILFLGYVLFQQIQEPIAFQRTKDEREKAVINQLIQIRRAQEVYRDITGGFASSFPQLLDSIENGRYRIIKVFGDPDDPNSRDQVRFDTTYVSAIDSVRNMRPPLVLSRDMGLVPFGEGATFEIFADTVSYQAAFVDVVEVGVEYAKFMGEFADPKFKKYDERYDPKRKIKFGDRSKPILTGSWE